MNYWKCDKCEVLELRSAGGDWMGGGIWYCSQCRQKDEEIGYDERLGALREEEVELDD